MIAFDKHVLILGGENFENLFFEFLEIDEKSGFISTSNINSIPQNQLNLAKTLGAELKSRLKDPKLSKYCFS